MTRFTVGQRVRHRGSGITGVFLGYLPRKTIVGHDAEMRPDTEWTNALGEPMNAGASGYVFSCNLEPILPAFTAADILAMQSLPEGPRRYAKWEWRKLNVPAASP